MGTGPVGLCPMGNMRITESTLTRHSPSPPRMTADEATRSETQRSHPRSTNSKRSRSSVGPEVLLDDGATRKRPRRATKETWKAREVREELELLSELRNGQTP